MLRGQERQYQSVTAQLEDFRTQLQAIGPALMDPPSPLHTETEEEGDQSDALSKNSQEDQDLKMQAVHHPEDLPDEEWQQPRRKKNRGGEAPQPN